MPTQQGLKPDAIFSPEDDKVAQRLDRIAWLMDRAITVPGTNIKVGLDALLGLFPFGGDVATGLVQAGLVLFAIVHYKVPKAVAARMVANVLLDVSVGALPVVGDVFDVFFKANTRNVTLLREVVGHQTRGQPVPTGSSVRFLIGLGALLGLTLATVLAIFVLVVVLIVKTLVTKP
jgi:hypothetical protein